VIGNLYKVTLNPGLTESQRNDIFTEISKIKGVNKHFNEAAKPKGDEFFVHTMLDADKELNAINGVKSVFQMPVA
jgi:hypothetical protein